LPDPEIVDVVVVGAGVIGMATALELVERGLTVRILERGKPGGESSWAGAGIIYPAFPDQATDPFERLRGESFAAWPRFAERMSENVGFFRCGAIVLEPTAGALERVAEEHRSVGALVEPCDAQELEPNLHVEERFACHLPEACQVRNPWLVRALAWRLERRGVKIHGETSVVRILQEGRRAVGVETVEGDRLNAGRVLVTAGAWTAGLLPSANLELVPIRGQILLFKPKTKLLSRIIDAGKHYLVPRSDGRILVGSTEERAGFEKAITTEGFEELYSFAVSILPSLATAEVEASWSGLRPGTPSGTPYLFEVEQCRGLWVAAGHFRLGLQLAPGTAFLLADWITGREGFATPADFGPHADRSHYRRSFTG
jgi:glycine oxidase